jgi:hypothetical protein
VRLLVSPPRNLSNRSRPKLGAEFTSLLGSRGLATKRVVSVILVPAMPATLDQWAAEGRLRTVVMEDGVKKVSVIDVICASKGCTADTARSTYARLLVAGKISPFARALCPKNKSRGGARSAIPVANAAEVIQLLYELPGDSLFKRTASNLIVRYLGGDTTLAGEVDKNKAIQERLAVEAPDHPARMFGEVVENGQLEPISCVCAPTKRRIEDQSTLYIFHYDFCAKPIKIGRTQDVDKRRATLGSGHAFRLLEFTSYPGAGYLEQFVHWQLREYQSKSGSGTEWFDVSVEDAQQAVETAIRLYGLK